ncbi:MAG: hypothetical protein WCV62_05045 [Candidatus Peribacteraceae bacterium]|jgi:hypothetical protein
MSPSTPDDKLDQILTHLQNLDRRDRLRTWGGFIRSLLALIPILIFLFATWYSIRHMDEIILKVTTEAAKQAASFTKAEVSESLSSEQLQQLQKFFQNK